MNSITLTDYIAAVALVFSVISVVIAISQTKISARTFERDTLLKVQEHAIANDIANKFELVAKLPDCASYEEFGDAMLEREIRDVQQVVGHLNYCAQLVNEGYLKQQLVWNRYFWMYYICSEKLLPWWVRHHQDIHRNRYINFEHMCAAVSAVTEAEIEEFDRKKWS